MEPFSIDLKIDFNYENHLEFNNFCSIGLKIVKQKTCTTSCYELFKNTKIGMKGQIV
jgi:hypothetical protein